MELIFVEQSVNLVKTLLSYQRTKMLILERVKPRCMTTVPMYSQCLDGIYQKDDLNILKIKEKTLETSMSSSKFVAQKRRTVILIAKERRRNIWQKIIS